jgi:sulfoxide reductase heme-binding subunit YedZ
MNRKRRILLLKVGVWGLGLFPLAQVAWWLRDGLIGLGANPIEKILLHSGWWTLVLLMATLAITPLRRVTGRNELVKLRRPMGLFAFFWATMHLGIYLGLDQFFEWRFIWEDIAERPFITVGFTAWLILLSLAFTSTRGWIRRLGRKWTLLHRGAYLAGLLGIIHFYWKVKADTREPLIFAAVFVGLMALRMRWTARRVRSRARSTDRSRSKESHAGHGAERGPAAAGADREVGARAGVG